MSLFQNMDSSNNILKKDYEENKSTENNKIPFYIYNDRMF